MNLFNLIFSILNFAPLADTVVSDIEAAVTQISKAANGFNILQSILATLQTIVQSVETAIANHPDNPANSSAASGTQTS